MVNSNNVCRDVLDTQSVIKNQITSLLVAELVSNNTVNNETCKNLSTQISKCIDGQTDLLIDRLINEFQKKR